MSDDEDSIVQSDGSASSPELLMSKEPMKTVKQLDGRWFNDKFTRIFTLKFCFYIYYGNIH